MADCSGRVTLLMYSAGKFTCVIPFPNTPFLDRQKLKESTDNNWIVAIKRFSDTDCIEKIAEKVEIAYFEQFHLFSTMFSYSFFLQCIKMSIYGEEGK